MDSMIKKLYDLAFAIAEIGEEIGFTQGFKCALQLRTRAPVFVR